MGRNYWCIPGLPATIHILNPQFTWPVTTDSCCNWIKGSPVCQIPASQHALNNVGDVHGGQAINICSRLRRMAATCAQIRSVLNISMDGYHATTTGYTDWFWSLYADNFAIICLIPSLCAQGAVFDISLYVIGGVDKYSLVRIHSYAFFKSKLQLALASHRTS